MKKPAPLAVATEVAAKKKPGRPPKAASADAGDKRGPKAKVAGVPGATDVDLSDIEAEFSEEPAAAGEKVKPLRMKISKAKERALMKEFGLDETVLSEEDLAKRRQLPKALINLGNTRGYLTPGEIPHHPPDQLVAADTPATRIP